MNKHTSSEFSSAPLTRRGLLGRAASLGVSLCGLGVLLRADKADAAAWNNAMELAVEVEINTTDGGRRSHRPYVAVWIEDADGRMVRTLSLWVQTSRRGPQWIPDLRQWYRDEMARRQKFGGDLVATVSEPTRAPGKYLLVWDGRDDRGNVVAQGNYSIAIEAAREHGTYQILRSDVTLGSKPFTKELEGNIEIKGARLAYRRK